MALQNMFGNIALDATIANTNTLLTNGTSTKNLTNSIREIFSSWPTSNWTTTTGTNDIISLEGNAFGITYLTLSKDPFTQNTESSITSTFTIRPPFDLIYGVHMSQRTVGQEFSVEVISNDTPTTPIADVAISSISQTTTTLTITTATAHGYTPGMCFGIYGISDSRLNYTSLVVSSIPSSTQIIATAGPMGTISSVTTGPFTSQGYIYYRPRMSYAIEGASQIFENSTASNASYYVGDVITTGNMPSGTTTGNHSVSINSTASVVQASSTGVYAYTPTTEFSLSFTEERIQFYDVGVDSTAASGARYTRVQVVPDYNKDYKLKFKLVNNKTVSIPNARIVSASKTASTTATITTDIAHGLTTSDYVTIYGIGDTTNFPNLTTQTIVASVINSTQFTIVIGPIATATSSGGFVSRSQGGQNIQGVSTVAVQQASVASNLLTLVGIGTWSGFSIGDFVNTYGVLNRSTGADLGVDGVFRVRDMSSSTVILEPIGTTTLPASLSLTTTGGAIIKRTDARINFIRGIDYKRERVEFLPRVSGDAYNSPQMGAYITSGTINTASLAAPTLANDLASSAVSGTTTSTTFTPASGSMTHQFNVIVTVVSGTNPTMDIVVQESDDSGTNWYDVYHFPRITTTGQYRSPLIPLTGNRIRYVRTLGGTAPVFTHSVNRLQNHTSQPLQRQFFDRTIVPNTLNSVTPSWFVDGCVSVNIVISMGAITTTAPVIEFEGSMDNSSWYTLATAVTPTASTNSLTSIQNCLSRYVRCRISTAGTGATLNYIMCKGIGN